MIGKRNSRNARAGGQTSTAAGLVSSIGGGANSSASGSWSSVLGGSANVASGVHASILGGNGVLLTSDYGTYPAGP